MNFDFHCMAPFPFFFYIPSTVLSPQIIKDWNDLSFCYSVLIGKSSSIISAIIWNRPLSNCLRKESCRKWSFHFPSVLCSFLSYVYMLLASLAVLRLRLCKGGTVFSTIPNISDFLVKESFTNSLSSPTFHTSSNSQKINNVYWEMFENYVFKITWCLFLTSSLQLLLDGSGNLFSSSALDMRITLIILCLYVFLLSLDIENYIYKSPRCSQMRAVLRMESWTESKSAI